MALGQGKSDPPPGGSVSDGGKVRSCGQTVKHPRGFLPKKDQIEPYLAKKCRFGLKNAQNPAALGPRGSETTKKSCDAARPQESLEFDGCAGLDQLGLGLFGLVLADLFEDGLWCTINEVLGFL